MSDGKPVDPAKADTPIAGDDPRSKKLAEIVKSAFGALTPLDQERVFRELAAIMRPIPAPMAGEVLSTIIRLLPERRDWTVEDIKEKIAQSRIGASTKEIYNAISYLARRGHIVRVGYGRYVVGGINIETADDLGGEPSRTEKMDPN
jgi:hypothetical protein